MNKKNENTAGSDGGKGENQLEQGQRQIEHDHDDAGDGDDKNNLQMTNDERDDTNDSQALTGGDVTKYTALVARISYLSQDRPDLKFAAMQVCCAMASPSVSDACSVGHKLVSPKRTLTQTGEATRPPDDRCQLE